MDKVLINLIPTMTSNTKPKGVCYVENKLISSDDAYYPFQNVWGFDGLHNLTIKNNTGIISYEFDKMVKIFAISFVTNKWKDYPVQYNRKPTCYKIKTLENETDVINTSISNENYTFIEYIENGVVEVYKTIRRLDTSVYTKKISLVEVVAPDNPAFSCIQVYGREVSL